MRVLDRSQMGYRILQDHRPGEDASTRLATGGVRIVDQGEGLTRQHIVGKEGEHHTYGDDHPYRFWQGEGRGFGSWSPAFAAASQGAGGGATVGLRQADGSIIQVPVSNSDGEEDAYVDLLPMLDAEYEGDPRYATVTHKVLPWMQLYPKGYHLIGMAGTQEREQADLMLSADPRLIAPHFAGPDRAGTIVTDLDGDGSIPQEGPYGIGGRSAPLQTHLRVVRLPKIDDLGNERGNGLAWVGTLTQQGSMIGGASYWGPKDSAAPQPDTVHPASPKTGGASGPTTPSTTDPNAAPGPAYQQPAGSVAPSNSVAPAGSKPPEIGPGQVALMDWALYGPMKVGSGKQDKHALEKRTLDDESISSGHIGTTAFYHMDSTRDAPLAFNRFPYPNVGSGPYPYKVFLSYERRVFHDHFGRQVRGLWDWWTAIPLVAGGSPKTPDSETPPDDDDDTPDTPVTGGPGQTVPDEPPPPAPPPPPPPPPTTGDGTPFDNSGGGNSGGGAEGGGFDGWRPFADRWKNYASAGPAPRPPSPAIGAVSVEASEGPSGGPPQGTHLDIRGGSGLASRLIESAAAEGERSNPSYMMPVAVGFASSSWRPQDFRDGHTDYRHSASFGSETSKVELARRPSVIRSEAWGHHDGADWVHIEQPDESRSWGGTSLGGVLRMPPEREMLDYRDAEPAHPGTYRYDTYADGVGLAFGAPDIATGALVDGSMRLVRDSSGRLSLGYYSGGWDEQLILDPSTQTLLVDMSGAIQIPQGGDVERPSTPAAAMLRWNTDGTEVEVYDGGGWIPVGMVKTGMSVVWNTSNPTPTGWSTDSTMNTNLSPGTGYSWIKKD